MAQAIDATSSGSGSSTLSITHVCTGSNLVLFVMIISNSSSEYDGVPTYNGVALTRHIESAASGIVANFRYAIYYLINPATGSHTLSVPIGSSASKIMAAGISITDANQTNPIFNSTTTSNQNSATATASIGADTNGFILGLGVNTDLSGGATMIISSGTTLITKNELFFGGSGTRQAGIGYLTNPVSGASSITVDFQDAGATPITRAVCISVRNVGAIAGGGFLLNFI